MNNIRLNTLIKYKRFFSIKKLKGQYYRVYLKQLTSLKYLKHEKTNLDGIYLVRNNEVFLLSRINKQNIILKTLQKGKPSSLIEYIEILHFLRPIRKLENKKQKITQEKIDMDLAQYLINNETFLKIL